jgi:hypothetical protein
MLPGFSAQLASVCKEYQDRVFGLEADKWDLERRCKVKMLEVKRLRGVCPGGTRSLRNGVEPQDDDDDVDLLLIAQVRQICKEYFDRMYQCESQKHDMEHDCRKREFEVLSLILLLLLL